MATRHPIFAVVAPSQCGKSTLIKRMLERFPAALSPLKSLSTRARREPDDDIFYRLVSVEDFMALKAAGSLVQNGNTTYAGHYYDNDRVADDILLSEKAGICAWVEPTVVLYRKLGYRVIMVRIVPDGFPQTELSLQRADADIKREVEGPTANKFILNAFGEAGLQRATEMMAEFIADQLVRDTKRSTKPPS